MIRYRPLEPSDLGELASIDRSDYSDCWCVARDGEIVLQERIFSHPGFSRAQWEDIASELGDKLAGEKALLVGSFDGETLVGIAGLETDHRYGPDRSMFNFSPLWISKAYRGRGIGGRLFTMVREKAEKLGIDALYVSATPVPGTVGFYTKMGCKVLINPDPTLFAREPEDIHMQLELPI